MNLHMDVFSSILVPIHLYITDCLNFILPAIDWETYKNKQQDFLQLRLHVDCTEDFKLGRCFYLDIASGKKGQEETRNKEPFHCATSPEQGLLLPVK